MRLDSYSFFCQVGRLAGVVQDVCERTGCTVVLDMGSGLVSTEMHTEILNASIIPSRRPVFDHFHTAHWTVGRPAPLTLAVTAWSLC